MDFEYSEEQQLLRDTVERFVADKCDFEARRHAIARNPGWSRDLWRQIAELGLTGIPFAEADGGFGGGGVEQMIVMEAFGRALLVEPYFASIVLAGAALRHGGNPEQRAAWTEALMTGEGILALAHYEPDGLRHDDRARGVTAQRGGTGWRLNGDKVAVLHGDSADALVVSASTGSGTTLFLVPGDADGVSRRGQRGYDGVRVATVSFRDVHVGDDALLGGEGRGEALLARVFDEAAAALCAEAVGVMARALDVTVEYLKTREQFGVPIGSFQALQHRAVDMLIELELARSMAVLAALSLDLPEEERRRNIAAAKVRIGQAGRTIGQQAVQLHGAIGITDEYEVGHAFTRLTAIDALLGDVDYHLTRLADWGGLGTAEAA